MRWDATRWDNGQSVSQPVSQSVLYIFSGRREGIGGRKKKKEKKKKKKKKKKRKEKKKKKKKRKEKK